MADRGFDASRPHPGFLSDGGRLVVDRRHFLAVAVPEIANRLLLAGVGFLGLRLFPFGSAVRLRLLPQSGRSMTGSLGLAKLGKLFLRLRDRPTFGCPA